MEDSDLGRIASELSSEIDDDMLRQDWQETYKRGIEFLGMQYEERAEPLRGHLALFTRFWLSLLRVPSASVS